MVIGHNKNMMDTNKLFDNFWANSGYWKLNLTWDEIPANQQKRVKQIWARVNRKFGNIQY